MDFDWEFDISSKSLIGKRYRKGRYRFDVVLVEVMSRMSDLQGHSIL